MNSNWIKDMLQTLGIGIDIPATREDARLKKSQNMLAKLSKEKRSMEESKETLKTLKKVNGVVSGLIIAFNAINFSFFGLFAAIAYNVISNSFLENRIKIVKRRIQEWDKDILSLESTIEEQMAQVASEKNSEEGTRYVDAEIINEYPNQDTQAAGGEDVKEAETMRRATVKEAEDSYRMLDKLPELVSELESHDHEVGILFRNTYQSAAKVAGLLQENPGYEPKMYLYYNNVETLYDWAENLLELEKNDVYESLLVNVKTNARKALPVLQAKIDKEYYKIVNPKIMDLEAEMEVMSKEQF